MRPILVVAFVFLAAEASAQPSQPPVQGKRPTGGDKQQSASQIQGSPASNQTPAAPSQSAADLPTSVVNQFAESQTAHDPNNETSGYNWNAISALFSLIVGLLQFYVMKRQADISELQRQLINTQTVHMESGLAIAREQTAITKRQNEIIETQVAMVKEVERAYIAISHKPPGLSFSKLATQVTPEVVPYHDVSINLVVNNLGNTPADVTATLFHFLTNDEPLPNHPPYDHRLIQTTRASVVKGDHLDLFANVRIPASDIAKIKLGSMALCVLGYVDYIDKFGQRHRTGYGRRYEPSIDKNVPHIPRARWSHRLMPEVDDEVYSIRSNLPFVTQPGYNYNRERQRGEGNDWDEPNQKLAP